MGKPCVFRYPSDDESLDSDNGWLPKEAIIQGAEERGWHNLADITLWYESDLYHVRGVDRGNHKLLFWESFVALGEARHRFSQGF